MVAPQNRPRKLLYLGIFAMVPVVFGSAVLIYSQINSADQARACQLEYQTVQNGLFAYMAVNSLPTVPSTSPTSDMTSPIPLYSQNPAMAMGRFYVPNPRTRWSYGWDVTGKITVIMQSPDGPSIPVGCVVEP